MTIKHQVITKTKKINSNIFKVDLRFDDSCNNGHETFSITGEYDGSFGCIHDDIAKHFPELAHLIKWHLVSTDGPIHYVANTRYLAGDKDYNGLKKGEHRQIVNGRTGEPAWHLVVTDSDGNEAPQPKYADSFEKPTSEFKLEWRPWERIGEGKERELEAARRAAVWPDATDSDLTAPDLKERLLARLPALLEAFKKDMLEAGFAYPEK